jgi:ribonuclease HI
MLEAWIDGSCEPTGKVACIGFVIKNNVVTVAKKGIAVGVGKGMTSNVAEYYALIHALREIQRLKLEKEEILVRSDSELLVKRMNREYKVRALHLEPLVTEARSLIRTSRFKIVWIRREQNEEADELANLAFKQWLADGKVAEEEPKKPSHGLNFFLRKP